MPQLNFLIVADRGNVKAYSVLKGQPHGVTATLEEQVEFNEAHQKLGDQLTDQAGAFPSGGTAGQGNGTAERLSLENENDSRLFHRIGQTISELITKHEPLRWSFAAPAEINGHILKHVTPKLREALAHNLKHDYVKTPVKDIPKRFGLEE
ncbi:MAG TPA: host attachment protein [Chthoniobacterales bacterium]